MPDDYVSPPPKTRGLNTITGAMSLIIVLLIVQIWLLSATLEALLANRPQAAAPAAIISGVMFVCCFLLYMFVERVDHIGRSGGSR